MPKTMTLRMDDERAAALEMVARADGQSLTASMLKAIDAHIDARRQDPAFRERLQKLYEDERALYERLAK